MQVPHPVHIGLVIVADDQPFHDLHGLRVSAKEHIVGQGAGQRGYHLRVSDVMDHPIQRHLLGIENGVAVLFIEIVQRIKAKLKGLTLFELAAAEIDFLGRVPVRLGNHMIRYGIENPQKLWRIGLAHMDAKFGDDDLPIAGGLVDDLQLVPDFQQLQKQPVVALDLPLLVFV